ncbi:hypothetical protein Holit_00214 [Hollandina sp. SP2]
MLKEIVLLTTLKENDIDQIRKSKSFKSILSLVELKNIKSLSQNHPAQIIKYWIIRKAARQRTAPNNTKDTFVCPLT